jgi:hypothetical protein
MKELSGLRDGLIQCLSVIQNEIGKRSTQIRSEPVRVNMENASMIASNRISNGVVSSERDGNADLESELRTGLGLLLKHRGGPGFGHGRLNGVELDSLENRLRSITKKLSKEINSVA